MLHMHTHSKPAAVHKRSHSLNPRIHTCNHSLIHSLTLPRAFVVRANADINYQTEQVSDYEAAYWGPNYVRLQQVCLCLATWWLCKGA